MKSIFYTIARDVFLNSFIASMALPRPLRWRLLRLAGLSVEKSYIAAGGFYGGTKIHIGRNASLNYDTFLDASEAIYIGAQVQFGPGVRVITSTHEIGPQSQRSGTPVSAPVTIGDGCWIGAGVIILPGSNVGPGTVVAAGAVVTRDLDANCLYAGVPARKIRDLF